MATRRLTYCQMISGGRWLVESVQMAAVESSMRVSNICRLENDLGSDAGRCRSHWMRRWATILSAPGGRHDPTRPPRSFTG